MIFDKNTINLIPIIDIHYKNEMLYDCINLNKSKFIKLYQSIDHQKFVNMLKDIKILSRKY